MQHDLLIRFFLKIKPTTAGCWLWSASRSTKGYGQIRVYGVLRPAHIVAYEHWRGKVPKGKVLDHVHCDCKHCVNPWHVEPSTNKANVLRGNGPTAINARRTHCCHGHLLSEENVYRYKGTRQCIACQRGYARDYRERQRKLKRECA